MAPLCANLHAPQLKQATKRAATLEKQRAKAGEDRAEAAAAAGERAKELERLGAALRAAEKLARERGEAVEAERAARSKEQRWVRLCGRMCAGGWE